jgi:hypothetical protein
MWGRKLRYGVGTITPNVSTLGEVAEPEAK